MANVKITVRKRLLVLLIIFTIAFLGLTGRLAFIQIVNSGEYQEKAMEQWTKDVKIPSKRGIIFDRNGKKLAISATAYEVIVNPAEVKDKEAVASALASALDMDKTAILEKISKKQASVTIKKKVDGEIVKVLREKELKGVVYTEDSKRFYPQRNFASYVLGFTSIDNLGQDGVEKTFDKYLNGFPGRSIRMTDARNQELPDSDSKYYEPQDGLNLVLTIDEVIQHFAEKAVENTYIEQKAKRVTAIVMQPKTGDILALAVKGDYDNNDPRKTPDSLLEIWNTLTPEQQYQEMYKMWRNPAVSDTYEPGSTFKIITTAAGLEEKVVSKEDRFYDAGYVIVAGKKLKCWRYNNPHGAQSFVEGVQNSCNPVFIEVGQRLGEDKFYKYIKGFGFGEPTNVQLPGEAAGLVMTPAKMGPVELATVSFGQGIAVTPIQLITAVSAAVNDGYLMEPRIAKKLVDNEGTTVHEFQPKTVRQVISKETSAELREILESVVSEGTGKSAYVPGYKIGGKTGTAQKAENGRYVSGKYVASFVGFAPANDPQIAVLVVIDEPGGYSHFGGQIASPVVKSIISDTLRYLDVKPQYTQAELELMQKPLVTVPEVRNMAYKDAIKLLTQSKLNHQLESGEGETSLNSLIVDQIPKPGASINQDGDVILIVKPTDLE
ncbi:MAG: stage V sporulation protein D [Clostridiales bacterium GWB2_37_7]|nr:MAG: stage V sporulation protein D [Clostridiales bacterium GWB2_37_7]